MKKVLAVLKNMCIKTKNAFVGFGMCIKESVTRGSIYRIRTLTSLQIQNAKRFKKHRTTLYKVLMALLEVAVVAGLCFAMKYFVRFFEVYVLLKSIQPIPGDPIFIDYLVFFIGLYLIISVIDISAHLVPGLYKAQDNSILIGYPVIPGEIYLSKLLVVYIKEVKKAFFVIIPILVGFYLQKAHFYSLQPTYFFVVVFAFIAIPLLLTLAAGVISLLFTFLYIVFKKIPVIKMIIVLALVITGFVLLVLFLNSLPTNLKLMDLWSTIVDKVTLFIHNANQFLVFANSIGWLLLANNTLHIWLGILFIFIYLIVFFLLDRFVCYRYFFKAASNAKEITTITKYKSKDKQTKNVFFSFFKKELKTFARSEDGFMSSIVFVILLPLLIFTINKIFGTMYISEFGKKIIFSVNVLLCISVLTASNITCANSLSREASQFYLLKISPINTRSICYAKVSIHMIINIISLVLVGICLKLTNGVNTTNIYKDLDILMIVLISLFVTTGHLLWSFELDLIYPKVRLYTTGVKDYSNQTKSLFIGLGLAVLFTILMILFLFVFNTKKYGFIDTSAFNFKWLSVLIFAILFLVSRIILFTKRLNAKFEEIPY